MTNEVQFGIAGDFRADSQTHVATNRAIKHAARASGLRARAAEMAAALGS